MARKPTSIDEYLVSIRDEQRAALERIRRTIRSAAPEAKECIRYGIPAFRLPGGVVAGFQATRRGCSYYPFSGTTLGALADELGGYDRTKSAVHFSPDAPLPAALVRKLVRARIAELSRPACPGGHRAKTPGERGRSVGSRSASAQRAPRGLERKTFVALLRGVNVGGKNRLPMKELRAVLEKLGGEDVRTYLQSGNAVFRKTVDEPNVLAAEIGAALRESHGFEPSVLVLELADLERAIRGNPYPEAEEAPQSLHLFFLDATPRKPDLSMMARLRRGTERFSLEGNLLYLHAPDGVGRSKLAARAEHALGVSATARNWRTICGLRTLATA
jgi:uncharacterized protein (DUF1697 family)/uncharacterized protein YdhG (YjbR/CyaY superfamily)